MLEEFGQHVAVYHKLQLKQANGFWAVQNFTVNECGPVHITMGDGGNIEGLSELSQILNCVYAYCNP